MANDLPQLYPLTFEPVLRDYVWGGRNLERLYGRFLPTGVTAESWEVSAHRNGSTKVDSGPLRGWSLRKVMTGYGQQLVGRLGARFVDLGTFPLLVKLLDTQQRLSVQVHPADAYAFAHENGDLGKTELWYILHAPPDAKLILGLKGGITPAGFKQAIDENRLEECLHYTPVNVGDAILITPGTVHAATEGLVLAEILQNSDTTYRVFDWGRPGADGRPRALHIPQALDVIDFDRVEQRPAEPLNLHGGPGIERQLLGSCSHFVVETLRLSKSATYAGHAGGETFEIWGVVRGEVALGWDNGSLTLETIRFCLIPACLGDFFVRALSPATVLRVRLPG